MRETKSSIFTLNTQETHILNFSLDFFNICDKKQFFKRLTSFQFVASEAYVKILLKKILLNMIKK